MNNNDLDYLQKQNQEEYDREAIEIRRFDRSVREIHPKIDREEFLFYYPHGEPTEAMKIAIKALETHMSSQELAVAVKEKKQISNWSPDQVDLIKRQICKNASDDELKLFMYNCNHSGLDPFAKQIYAVKRWDSKEGREVMSVQTSIDGFRLIAQRTEKYDGQVGPYWCGLDGIWRDVWLAPEFPSAAKVGVWRSGAKEPFWGVARWESYVQKLKSGQVGPMWAKMPDVMIAKCAESLALRKGFPQELSGLYTSDEMSQANNEKPSYAAAQPVPQIVPNIAPKKHISPDMMSEINKIKELQTDLGLLPDDIKAEVHREFGVNSVTELTLDQIRKFVGILEESLKMAPPIEVAGEEIKESFENFRS